MSKTAKANTDAFYEKGLTDKFPFTTLLKNEIQHSWNNTWYPIPVDEYAKAFKIDPTFNNYEALLKNLTYNMQYIEFLEKEFKELEVSSVLTAMLTKTYVITSVSILEAIFANLVWKNGLWLMDHKHPDKPAKEIKLFRLIQILEKHPDILNRDPAFYKKLKALKELRNKIHLQSPKDSKDHDYTAFEDETLKLEMGAVLYEILTSKVITDAPECFEFLKVNLDSAQRK